MVRQLMGSEFCTEKFSYNLPSVINPSARYVFFLHGKLVEKRGPNGRHPCFGIYDYHGIVKSFRNREFVVISEVRPKGTKLDKYAKKIVSQIKTLLTYGISPKQITVVGFSKGSAIALLVSAMLKDFGINFVIMSGCSFNDARVLGNHRKFIEQSVQYMQGRFLYIYDVNDQKCDIWQRILKNTSANGIFKEMMLKNGLGHSLFYRPRKEWIEPMTEWISQEH
jgi:predicted esterase